MKQLVHNDTHTLYVNRSIWF